MNFLTKVIVENPVDIQACKGLWRCISPADWLMVVMTSLAIAIPLIATIVLEKKKSEKEKKDRIQSERAPLKKELALQKLTMQQLMNNFSILYEKDLEQINFLKKISDNETYLHYLKPVFHYHEKIRTDEIDRMRLFFADLVAMQGKIKYKYVKNEGEHKGEEGVEPLPAHQVYSQRDFGSHLAASKKEWDKILTDYKLNKNETI
ncbi:hypothetical protein [Halobacillus massiliensis]|uniref:hypothetical protein n=1 Tax=Halobacillus massiliensis TaxID=1926286 RepID=UPI0009E45512|nr:hypothetical protein [Halobacillus massiliensis]